ncbi:hypothetical protein HKX48_003060 [Thoreauomyces humboldtii]|nr:hypothetical protein HKX48_003060 [Thoreauomyces humboldtii]
MILRLARLPVQPPRSLSSRGLANVSAKALDRPWLCSQRTAFARPRSLPATDDRGPSDNIWRDEWTFNNSSRSSRGKGKAGASLPPVTAAPQWVRDQEVGLTRQAFLDMLDGRTPLIRSKSFASRDECAAFERELSPRLNPYRKNLGPALKKVGVAQFEYQAQGGREEAVDPTLYHEAARDAWSIHDELRSKCGTNLMERAMRSIAALFPDWNVGAASEGHGREYYAGIYRVINESTPVHCDWSPYDSGKDWLIGRITKQVVFNLCLVPVLGGKTVIHDLQWSPASLAYRDVDTYGYDPSLVAGRTNATAWPVAGDMVLFNTRNFHQVFPVEEDRHPITGVSLGTKPPRITLSSFIGYLPPSPETGNRPSLIFWS